MGGVYRQPWTYSHAIKDYVDMAAHIEAMDGACAVVNFAPVLLEQLHDYTEQFEAFFTANKVLNDPILAALGAESLDYLDQDARLTLFKACQKANQERLINRFAPYKRLVELADFVMKSPEDLYYLSDQYLWDLLFWYHLAWMGETVRRDNPDVTRWVAQAQGFSHQDRIDLLHLIGGLVGSVIPRYKALAEQGKVELAFSPYKHPIVPLMLDFKSARDAMPDIELPDHEAYPDGAARAAWHVQKGIEVFQQHFGLTPTGCWPSEGSLSMETLTLLEQHGVQWAASGQAVFNNSLRETAAGEQTVHRPYRLLDNQVYCFFRDDQLSDAIGFEYANWHADDAVANFVHNLVTIAEQEASEVVSIILDGENAWEYYPENAWYFLSALYKELAEHPQLELSTFANCVDNDAVTPGALSKLVAGSCALHAARPRRTAIIRFPIFQTRFPG
ncbi:MAG: glycoside hydrolase family 57 protein [Pseudomonadota bacterium]